MSACTWYGRGTAIAGLVLVFVGPGPAAARSHAEGRVGVPAMVIARGRVVRASLGVGAVSLTPQLAHANDLPIERSALVIRVEPGGAGEAVGLEPGDVITSMDGRPVTDLHHLHEALSRHRVGEAVAVAVWRDGLTLTLRPVLGQEP